MERACDLYLDNYAPLILPSGGPNSRLEKYPTEWDWFFEYAKSRGVPEKAILKENKAQNTFENARFSKAIINERKLAIRSAILVTKAFHSRRALLTYQTEFSNDIEYTICPIIDRRKISKDNWMHDQEKIDKVFNEIEKIGKYFGSHVQTLENPAQNCHPFRNKPAG
jgi:uncharacterized SAM-binding protein YcdF (DUF218 family)